MRKGMARCAAPQKLLAKACAMPSSSSTLEKSKKSEIKLECRSWDITWNEKAYEECDDEEESMSE